MNEIDHFEPDEEDDDGGKTDRVRMEVYDWLQCIVFAILCGIFIFVFLGRTIGVEGPSMMQTLHDSDRVIMSNLFYTPRNGDVIVFQSPSYNFDSPLVKRVIGIGGDTVEIKAETGEVLVNGIVLNEPYINELTISHLDIVEVVPEGYVFVMGDNRNRSTDSRSDSVGLVDTRYILGRVLFVAIPGADHNATRDWSRIGVVR